MPPSGRPTIRGAEEGAHNVSPGPFRISAHRQRGAVREMLLPLPTSPPPGSMEHFRRGSFRLRSLPASPPARPEHRPFRPPGAEGEALPEAALRLRLARPGSPRCGSAPLSLRAPGVNAKAPSPATPPLLPPARAPGNPPNPTPRSQLRFSRYSRTPRATVLLLTLVPARPPLSPPHWY